MKKSKLASALIGLMIATGANMAQATDSVNGSLWHVSEDHAKSAIPANIPAGAADVTFSVHNLFTFTTESSSATVAAWLASSHAFNIHENTVNTLTSQMDDGIKGTIVDFRGVVHLNHNQEFKVTHDDGVTLIINGVDLHLGAGPTSAVDSEIKWTGATGTYSFELIYAECCGGPAVLLTEGIHLTSPTPEPETYAMFMAGLGLMGFIARRRKNGQA